MRDPGRTAAAIDILRRFGERPLPLSVLVQDWSRGARYAGSKDRAFVRGLCLDVLRRWRSYRGAEDPRLGVLLTLRHGWGWEEDRIVEAFSGEHGDGALSEEERAAGPSDLLDLPAFLTERLGPDAARMSQSLADRAPVDLRVNTLKAGRDKALKAVSSLNAAPAPLSPVGLRIPPERASERGPGVTVIPAYGKGWVEVQDEGSQLTVLAAGPLGGRQVLDYCAGGGGKTLALAGEMNNTGQVFAYDANAQRLAPIHERLRRAGARNVQVIAPSEPEKLAGLTGKMDFVFADAPCTGAGTWRRHPDTKWRLTPEHLEDRKEEQGQVLAEAAQYVAPGGTLFFVTCSFLPEENEDRVEAFLAENRSFTLKDPLDGVADPVREALAPFADGRALRLAPWSSGTDAFTAMRLVREKG